MTQSPEPERYLWFRGSLVPKWSARNMDTPYRTAVEERYRVLRFALVIARKQRMWDHFEPIRQEKRALVRVRWSVRQARRREGQPAGVGYHDWQAA